MRLLREPETNFRPCSHLVRGWRSGEKCPSDRRTTPPSTGVTFCDIEHGGWRPKGCKAEDGTIQPPYQLTKTPPFVLPPAHRVERPQRQWHGNLYSYRCASGRIEAHGGVCQEVRQRFSEFGSHEK
jgi:hypothetical protein